MIVDAGRNNPLIIDRSAPTIKIKISRKVANWKSAKKEWEFLG